MIPVGRQIEAWETEAARFQFSNASAAVKVLAQFLAGLDDLEVKKNESGYELHCLRSKTEIVGLLVKCCQTMWRS